jgi:ribonuclease Z
MDITLLGTGCPICDTRRFGPANLVRAAGAEFLVDCGSGATQRLIGAGTRGADLEAVLLTHLHSDHIVDLYQLIVSSWHQGRARPQRVFGPPGTRRFVEGTMELWRPELELRIRHERRPSTEALKVDVTEIGPGEVLRHGDLVVTAVEVEHQPVTSAFGFVFAAAGRRIAISGDTRPCRSLIEAATDADVLVHEVMVHREMKVVAGVRSAETLANVASYHTLSDQVGRIAAEARVRALILTHFVPVRFDQAALLAEVRRDYPGPVVIGEDLMRIDAATGMVQSGDTVIGLAWA